jgi:hypothetical protein
MEQFGISKVIKNLGEVLFKNSPTILTGASVAGLVTSTILAIKATPKALSLIDNYLYSKLGADMYEKYGFDIAARFSKLSTREILRITWKCYIPTGAVALASIACIIGANTISLRRNAALAGMYTITETLFKEYQNKVTETIGRNKELKIRDEISADRIKANPPSSNEIVFTGKGDVLCYDSLSGRYFRSDIEKIRRVINELNHNLMTDMFVTLNELYYGLGLSEIQLGNDLGWDIDKGLIEVDFSAQLTEGGEPCLVLNYKVFPRFMN